MAQSGRPLSIVEQWKQKSLAISSKSKDCMTFLLSKGIDLMALVLNRESDRIMIRNAAEYLETHRTFSLRFDSNKDDELRSLLYGHLECLLFTICELTREKLYLMNNIDRLREANEAPTVNHMGTKVKIDNKKDDERKNDSKADSSIIKEEEMEEIGTIIARNEKDSSETVEESKKMRSSRAVSKPLNYTEESDVNFDVDSEPTKKKKKMRSSRAASKPLNYAEESDEKFDVDSEPTMKKSVAVSKKESKVAINKKESSSNKESTQKCLRIAKINATELECPDCEYRGKTAQSLTSHLRAKHSTTLALAGLVLRCDCGFDALSHHHGYTCDMANFTVVRTRDGPIQTFTAKKDSSETVEESKKMRSSRAVSRRPLNYAEESDNDFDVDSEPKMKKSVAVSKNALTMNHMGTKVKIDKKKDDERKNDSKADSSIIKEEEMEEIGTIIARDEKDSSETVEESKKMRSSRAVSRRPLNYAEESDNNFDVDSEPTMKKSVAVSKNDLSETVEGRKKRRSSIIISKPVNPIESGDNLDEDSVPTMKKSKVDSEKEPIFAFDMKGSLLDCLISRESSYEF